MAKKEIETRAQKIKRYLKYSKRDLVIMFLNTNDAFDELVKAIRSKKSRTIIRPKY